ncbi:MAG TPA: VOC family protein [Planctomycetota bacterium]|nr:VOC family protein [Planctomycetota bacterium]
MKAVNPYLNFPGTTEQAFLFYRSVFGGEFAVLQRFGDMPGGDQTSAQESNRIMHVSLPLPNGSVLMGTDACESMGQKLIVGNNFSISLECESEAEVTKLFTALTAGGKAEMSPQNTFWGAFFAMGSDRFGTQWMMNYRYPRTA